MCFRLSVKHHQTTCTWKLTVHNEKFFLCMWNLSAFNFNTGKTFGAKNFSFRITLVKTFEIICRLVGCPCHDVCFAACLAVQLWQQATVAKAQIRIGKIEFPGPPADWEVLMRHWGRQDNGAHGDGELPSRLGKEGTGLLKGTAKMKD